ncbi:MAG TPA: hypothetical protein VN822_08660 [Candidatus Acidoferrales bacterium]|nr:hypothetical protein [Candidatus Acidoferrales bacterium]
MKASGRLALSILLLAATAAQPLVAFDYPLSSEAIREAYFLGTANSDKRQAFFEKYRHNLPVPKSGADVALIEVETPFVCVVDAIAQAPMNYFAQEAEQDYLGKPGKFRVHVEIYFTPTYPKPDDTAVTLGDFWRDFKIHLKQDAEIPPLSVHGQPIYSEDTISGYIGATIDVEYNVKKIDAGGFTTVEVDTPDGQQVETTFQLNNLR